MTPRPDPNRAVDALLKAASRGRASAEPVPTPDCPDASVLAAWADGALAPADAEALEAHMAGCAYCGASVAVLGRSAPAVPRRLPWAIFVSIGLATAAAVAWLVVVPHGARPAAPATTVAQTEPAPLRTPPVVEPVTPTPPQTIPPRSSRQDRPPAAPPPGALQQAAPRASADAMPPAQAQADEPSRAVAAKPMGQFTPPLPAPTPPEPPAAATPAVQQPVFRAALDPAIVAQFEPPQEAASEARIVGAAGGAGGRAGGGRGGAVNVGGTASGQQLSSDSLLRTTRWRVLASGAVERTSDGSTWMPVTIDPPAFITAGTAPSAMEGWLVGRHGAVILVTAGWPVHVDLPEPVDLVSVQVTGSTVTVRGADGTIWTSADRGHTWTR